MVQMNKDCFFCKEIEAPSNNIIKKNRFVYETHNFVVFPTVGCFEIGYLLIMPKDHYLCFGELDDTLLDELDALIEHIQNYLEKVKGVKSIVFEHGTRDLSKLTATSIMHAHIHMIPFCKNLYSYLPRYCTLKKIEGFKNLKEEKENYLYVRDVNNNNYIVLNPDYPSQFFRRVVCDANGISNYWDWRVYPFVENMQITIDFYSGLYNNYK